MKKYLCYAPKKKFEFGYRPDFLKDFVWEVLKKDILAELELFLVGLKPLIFERGCKSVINFCSGHGCFFVLGQISHSYQLYAR